MNTLTHRASLLAGMFLIASSLAAKSLVLTLADARGTKVYYKLGGDVNPKMIIADDGTFTINGKEYAFANVKNFFISSTDYSGAANTVDAIASIETDGNGLLSGPVKVYSLDGRLLQTAEDGHFNLKPLPRGTYVISNGVSTLKIMKR